MVEEVQDKEILYPHLAAANKESLIPELSDPEPLAEPLTLRRHWKQPLKRVNQQRRNLQYTEFKPITKPVMHGLKQESWRNKQRKSGAQRDSPIPSS